MSLAAVVLPYLFADHDARRGSLGVPSGTGLLGNTPSVVSLDSHDANLLARIRAHDDDDARLAFAEVYRAQLHALVTFARRLVESQSVAEDIVADIFVTQWARRTAWSPQSGLRAYLFRAVRTRALDYLRNAKTAHRLMAVAAEEMRDVSPRVQAIDEQLDHASLLAAITTAIAQFPPLRRQVMELRWQHGLAIDEIAQVLTLSRASVDQHLSRGLHARRRLLPETLGG